MKNLKGRVAVITGAGSGIGRSLALKLADEGCNLAISDINEETVKETARLAEAKGVKAFVKKLDVADRKAMEAYPEEVIKELGGAHIIVNNAGVTVAATVEEHTIEDYEWLMGINFWGVLYGTKFFLPYLQKADEAHIVNISSIFGIMAVPNQSSYHAAKFAVRGFTESLRHELKDTHIGVSCVHPGGIRTNIAKAARFKSVPAGQGQDEFSQNFEKIARVTPDEAADTIIKGIRKKQERVLIGIDANIMDMIARLMPESYGWLVNMLATRV